MEATRKNIIQRLLKAFYDKSGLQVSTEQQETDLSHWLDEFNLLPLTQLKEFGLDFLEANKKQGYLPSTEDFSRAIIPRLLSELFNHVNHKLSDKHQNEADTLADKEFWLKKIHYWRADTFLRTKDEFLIHWKGWKFPSVGEFLECKIDKPQATVFKPFKITEDSKAGRAKFFQKIKGE